MKNLKFLWSGAALRAAGIVVLALTLMVTACENSGSETSELSGTVTIDGTAKTGQILTANTSALGGSGTISYQWLRGSTEISGATGSSYTVVQADEGSTISVRVTRAGYSGSKTGGPTAAVTNDERPALSGSVTITGIPTVGQTLTANTSALDGSGTISYQWLAGGESISGATGSSYMVTVADIGKAISVRVTRADNSASVTSTPTSTVIQSDVPAPTTNAEHLAMLKSLGVNVDNPDLPLAPNNQPYDPQGTASAANMRAVSGSGPSLGPLGKTYSQPKREIFAAGYSGINGKNHALFEDFGDLSNLTVLGQDSTNDSGWAGGTSETRARRKAVAADLDGDGIDEVVIVVLKEPNKMLIYKGVYNNSGFTITQVRDLTTPENVDQMLPNNDYGLVFIGWTLITADLNGDGKQECILTLPSTDSAYMYILDNNLARTHIDLGPYYPSGVPTGHGWFPMVTAADYDQDGKDELCLTIGVNESNFNARYYILDYNGAGFTTLSENVMTSGTFGMRMGRAMAGDFTGDGLPDTVFYGTRNNDNTQRIVMLLETSLNSAFQPVFTWVDSASRTFPDDKIIPQSAVGDVNGDRKADFIADNRLYTLSSENKFELFSPAHLFGTAYNGGQYDVVMGDVTGDGQDDVVLFGGGGNIEIYYYAGGEYVQSGYKHISDTSYWETGCLPNVDNDSFIMRDTGDRELLFSNPQIIAVLASPPYYEGINEDGDGGTSFGYSKGSGGSETHSGGFSVGMSVGYEFKVPLIGTGTEFEASMKNSFSWAQSTSKERNETWGWNTPVGEDLVIFTAIPFDVYYYEVLRSPDGEEAQPGDILTVNVPRKTHTYHHELSYYNSHVPEAHRITVNHTLGDPSSYYSKSQRANLKSAAGNKGLFSLNTEITAGEGSGSSTIGMDQVTTNESSFAFDVEMEVKAAATFTGVKVGVSVGFSYGYETTTSVSNGTFIEGTVPSIPRDDYTPDKDFDWGLMAFPKWEGNHNFVFVTYWTEIH